MKINRKQILMSVLETIEGISDKEYQKRVWIRGEGPECADFVETCCNFFGDGDPLIENYKDFGISESQYHLLKKFRDDFRAFSDANDWPEEFIDTPEWARIMEMAKEVVEAFHFKKTPVFVGGFQLRLEELCSKYLDRPQPEAWVLCEPSEEESDFENVVRRLLESMDPLLADPKASEVTENQLQLLKKLYAALTTFCDTHDHPVSSPEWARIREMVDKTMRAFNFLEES